jgi:CheY-like chemotaxis protein
MVSELGGEAVAVASEGAAIVTPAGAQRPDAAVIDTDAAGLAEALRTAQTIRERHRIPVVFITARQDGPLLRDLFEVSPHVLFKPVLPGQLGAAIWRACEAMSQR